MIQRGEFQMIFDTKIDVSAKSGLSTPKTTGRIERSRRRAPPYMPARSRNAEGLKQPHVRRSSPRTCLGSKRFCTTWLKVAARRRPVCQGISAVAAIRLSAD